MDSPMGFGIVGLGMIAEYHAQAICALRQARLVGACSRTKAKADTFCTKYGGQPYDNFDDFLTNKELQVVCVTTPAGNHLETALKAMRKGKHVIIEKPLEVTTARCDELIRTAKECHVVLAGIFQTRFNDGPLLMKKAIEQGRFGKLTLCDAQVKWHRSQEYYDETPWHARSGGGALMNQAIHAIDLLQWFSGPVDSVSGEIATLGHEHLQVEDTGIAALRFKNGALGIIETTMAAYPGFPRRIEICGTKGSAILEEQDIVSWQFDEERPEDEEIRKRYEGRKEASPGSLDIDAYGREFTDVIEAITQHREPMVSGEEARKAVAIIDAMSRSATERHPVIVD